MKKLNNKGFAASTLLYVLVIMMFLIVLALMNTMGATRKNTKNLSDVIEDELNRFGLVNQSFSYDSNIDTEPRVILIDKSGWYKLELWGPGTSSTGGGHTEGIIYLEKNEILHVHLTPETGTLKSSYITWKEDDDDHIIMKTPGYSLSSEFIISGSAGYLAKDNVVSYNKIFYFAEIDPEVNHTKSKFKMSIISEGNNQPFKTNPNSKLKNIRYIKDCVDGNRYYDNVGLKSTTWGDWSEIQAMFKGKDVAKNATIQYQGGGNNNGLTSSIINGKPYDGEDHFKYDSSGYRKKCVILDLKSKYNLEEIAVWHFVSNLKRFYINHTMSVSSDNITYKDIITSSDTNPNYESTYGIRYSDAYIQ